MIVKLSHLLRTALDRDQVDLVSCKTNSGSRRNISIWKRCVSGSRLKIEWLIPPATYGLLVPQMILQPLVEKCDLRTRRFLRAPKGDGSK